MTKCFEKLNEEISVCVSEEHRFGTDAFLLADFSAPKKSDLCCDLGTGCGIIPMLLAKNFSPYKIYGVDIQENAIEQLKSGLSASKITCEVIPVTADLNALPSDMPFGEFKLITCNPPYKAEGSGILSDSSADKVARHETMCTIDDICRVAKRMLQFNGRLCICQRPERLADVICAMRANSIEPKRLRFVAKSKESQPWLFLIEGNKCARPFMKVEPPLYLYEKGEYTAEMQSIYAGNKLKACEEE